MAVLVVVVFALDERSLWVGFTDAPTVCSCIVDTTDASTFRKTSCSKLTIGADVDVVDDVVLTNDSTTDMISLGRSDSLSISQCLNERFVVGKEFFWWLSFWSIFHF
jgi:hypothetical protein